MVDINDFDIKYRNVDRDGIMNGVMLMNRKEDITIFIQPDGTCKINNQNPDQIYIEALFGNIFEFSEMISKIKENMGKKIL
jgi:hypothetical protein